MKSLVYNEDVDALCKRLGVELPAGLSDSDAATRLAQDGPNVLTQTHQKRAWQILLAQFSNLLVIILIIAVLYVPFMQGFFKTTALSFIQLGICTLGGVAVFAAVELEKLFIRLRHPA